MSDRPWTPRVGDVIKRRNDTDAPAHTVTAVRGVGGSCTLLIDGATRWWDGDIFECVEPVVKGTVVTLADQPVFEEALLPVREP